MPRRLLPLAGALFLTLVTALATSPPMAGALPAPPGAVEQTGTLRWRPCQVDAECARLAVPLDDTVAGGPTIELALLRYRAKDPEHRIGSLLVNPGGPGASGIDYVASAASSLPSELRDRFDIVGFDPRGVGRSAGVDCTDNLDGYFSHDWSPASDAERAALVESVRQLVDDCERTDGSILPFLSTKRAARDLERIRVALGDDKLTFLGFSYGTYLGSSYAEQFPTHVRALVFDGAVDPALNATAVQVQQAVGFERSLALFLRDCKRRSSCAFHRDGRPGSAYDALRTRVAAKPLPADGAGKGRTLNDTQFDLAVTQYLYSGHVEWEQLAIALDAADRGDGSDLLATADVYTGRDSDGSFEAFLAIGCADGPPVGGLAGMQAIEEQAAAVAPRLGRTIVNNSLPCALWPVEAPPAAALHAAGAPPLLVLGTRDDPATPLVWAQGLARQLNSGVLLTVDGERHTAFDQGNGCVDQIVVRYLVDLTAPRDGTRC